MAVDILILGGGPAGCCVALGMKGLGYSVTLITAPRPFTAVEGVSQRVVESLRGAGFDKALDAIESASPRQVTWNGVTSAANTERLISRSSFDAAMLEDLRSSGVSVVTGRVKQIQKTADGHQAIVQKESGAQAVLIGQFLVEARGRAAPSGGVTRIRGAETVSLLQYWQGMPLSAQSAVESFEQGWAWMACMPSGQRYMQLTLDVASAGLPSKVQLSDWCQRRFSKLKQAKAFIRQAEPITVYARTSTQILCRHLIGDDWIRVGDAAMAVDPLSGNGIFQSMSSALQSPAVINTLMKIPERRNLAKEFYQQRVEGLFYRFARTGRDFCREEHQWSDSPFWSLRRDWPDSEPLHKEVTPDQARIERRAVVHNQQIIVARVVTTPDQPLGVWHIDGIELAPLLERLTSSQLSAAELLRQQYGEYHTARLLPALAGLGLIKR